MRTPTPIETLKSKAREISRSRKASYCQALDALAREEGFPHWKALQAAQAANAPTANTSAPIAAPMPAPASSTRSGAPVAIVKLSDLTREGRMDAGFHIALSRLRGRIEELRAIYSAAEATRIVKSIPLCDKAAMKVLVRGDRQILNSANADALAVEYPHMSLALIEHGSIHNSDPQSGIKEAVARVSESIAQQQQLLETLLSIGKADPSPDFAGRAPLHDQSDPNNRHFSKQHQMSPAGFVSGMTYPLVDAERFDDELGEGYAFVAVPDGVLPGMTIVDAWPVNAAGEVHPGYDYSPIPIRLDDVHAEDGFKTVAPLPGARPFAGWR